MTLKVHRRNLAAWLAGLSLLAGPMDITASSKKKRRRKRRQQRNTQQDTCTTGPCTYDLCLLYVDDVFAHRIASSGNLAAIPYVKNACCAGPGLEYTETQYRDWVIACVQR
jgi:hypothetical protein